MKVIELNPYDYRISAEDEDGNWYEQDTLPLDEWKCTECASELGWVTYDNAFATNIQWTHVWIPVGSDPRSDNAIRLCEDCKQAHVEVEA